MPVRAPETDGVPWNEELVSKAFRDRVYASYFTSTYAPANAVDDDAYRQSAAVLRRLVLPWIAPQRGAAVLDVACGVGFTVEMLRQAGYSDVSGIDGSAEQVEVARRRGLPVTHEDAFEHLAAKREAYETILAFDFLEHLDRDELLRFLDLARGALRPRGRLVVKTPNASSPLAAHLRWIDLTHENLFTERSLRAAFITCGLSPVAIMGERYRPFTAGGWARAGLAAVLHGLWRLLLVADLGSAGLRLPLQFNLIGVAERP
jgi:2-polyprenyl-3-methyl-5-hydroxy-6-metoxy-1,4-benzoquinol methylase